MGKKETGRVAEVWKEASGQYVPTGLTLQNLSPDVPVVIH